MLLSESIDFMPWQFFIDIALVRNDGLVHSSVFSESIDVFLMDNVQAVGLGWE